MKVHYLQHISFEGLGTIEPWLVNQNHTLSSTKLFNSEDLPTAESIDWLIVLGGPMNIYEDHNYPWLTPEKNLIEQVIKLNKPVLGICLGAQLIADVLGARVYQGDHKEIGWFPIGINTNKSEVFNNLPEQLTVFHWHGDTFDLPANATHLAQSEGCQNQAFIYNNKVLGLQFHLEVTKTNVQALVDNCSDELIEGRYIQTPEEMGSKHENFTEISQAMAAVLSNFTVNLNPQVD